MKNPALEDTLKNIETQETKRRVRAAVILSKKAKQKDPKSRKAVMEKMIRGAKQRMRETRREQRRPTFGTVTRPGALLKPEPKPELDYDGQ